MNLRLLVVVSACLLAPSAHADQLIQIPTADRVVGPKAEYLHHVSDDEGYGTLLLPAGTAHELMFRYYNNFGGRHRIEGGGQFQLLPDGVITPGIAVGVWDVTNSSPFGRRAFLAITKSLDAGFFGIPTGVDRVQLTLGTGTGRFSGAFAAARIDLAFRTSLIAEYDARRFNAGIWFRPLPMLSLKGELQNGEPFVGGEVQLRF